MRVWDYAFTKEPTLTRFTATYSRRGNVHTEEAIEGAPRAYVFELK